MPKLSAAKTKKTTYSGYRYFLPHSRINRAQRKYCHCIMKARPEKGTPGVYNYCKAVVAKAIDATPLNKRQQMKLDISKTNCVSNYSYDDYTHTEIRAFMKEKGLPTFGINAAGKRINYSRDRMVQELTQNYIKKHIKSAKKQAEK